MNIIDTFRYLVSLEEHKHFSRAAQACHITQPALSNALKALEEEMGVKIVNRGRNYQGLTAEGRQVLASAYQVLHEIGKLKSEINSHYSLQLNLGWKQHFILDSIKKKIKYRSEYRGIKEMDLLLGAFVKKYIDNLNYNDLLDLYEILEKDDDVIFKWYSDFDSSINIPSNKVSKLLRQFKLK